MKNLKIFKTVLFLAGLIAAIVGAGSLFMPIAFNANQGIVFGENVNQQNEIREAGGALLASGIFIMIGAFVVSLRFSAAILATLLYLSYSLSRGVSIMIDGMPSLELVQIAVFELVVGLACAFVLLKYKQRD